MLTKITNKEIMTRREACELYRDKYICMIITQVVDTQDNDLGYVLYVADRDDELDDVPRQEYEGLMRAYTLGVAAEPEIQIGGIYVDYD